MGRNNIDMVVPEGVKKEKMNLAVEELEEIFPKDYKDSKDVVDEESYQREEIDAEVKSKQEIECEISNVEDSENEISQEFIATKVKDLDGNELVEVQEEIMEMDMKERMDNKQGEKGEENEDEIILKTEKTGDQSAATEDIEQITKEEEASYSEEEKSKSPRIEQSKDVNEIVMTTKEPIPRMELLGNKDKESLVKEENSKVPKNFENCDDICSNVENTENKVITKGDQIAEDNKKEKEIEKLEIESLKDKEDDQSSPKVEEKDDDICSEVENAEDEITTKEDQIAEVHKKEKEVEETGKEIIKDKEDDQSSPKVEEQEVDICSEDENAKDEITTKEDQIDEVHKKEKAIEEVGKEIIKHKKDDKSSPKVEEKEVDICSEVENAEDEITTKEDQIAEVHKKEKEIEKVGIE